MPFILRQLPSPYFLTRCLRMRIPRPSAMTSASVIGPSIRKYTEKSIRFEIPICHDATATGRLDWLAGGVAAESGAEEDGGEDGQQEGEVIPDGKAAPDGDVQGQEERQQNTAEEIGWPARVAEDPSGHVA